MEYTFEDLQALNASYDMQHEFLKEDYEKTVRIQKLVKGVTKQGKISRGDIVIFTARNGKYYAGARVDNIHESVNKVTVCEKPYIPFIVEKGEKYKLSMSGGAFVAIDIPEFKFVGKTEAMFHDWGHCGACANGAIKIPCEVNVWEVNIRKRGKFAEYTERDYEMIRVSDNRNEYGQPRGGSPYEFVGNGIAWKTEHDLNSFMKRYNGVEDTRQDVFHGTRVYWIYKRSTVGVFNKAEFDGIEAEPYEDLFNGRMVEHKTVINHEDHTATIYVNRSNEQEE